MPGLDKENARDVVGVRGPVPGPTESAIGIAGSWLLAASVPLRCRFQEPSGDCFEGVAPLVCSTMVAARVSWRGRSASAPVRHVGRLEDRLYS